MMRIERHVVLGGITAAVVALPLALAFGVASGAGALAGLYSAILVGFFAAVFGGTPSQISGPTGPMTVVAVGVVMACVLFVARMADAQMRSARLAFDPSEFPDLSADEAKILADAEGRITLFAVEGPLSFGSAKDIAALLRTNRDHEVLIIDLNSVPFIDSSASMALEEVVGDMHGAGKHVMLCAMRPGVRQVLDKIGVLKAIPEDCIVANRGAAVRAAERLAVVRS